MENKTIPASELPQISGVIKDVVNMGLWFLYEIRCESNKNAKYTLSTDKNEFLLDKDGNILSPLPKEDKIEYISKITFTGIPSVPTVNMPSI